MSDNKAAGVAFGFVYDIEDLEVDEESCVP